MSTKSVRVTNGLRCLKPVLRKWIRLNKKLLELWSPENAATWWFNERASVSLFSGAVWSCGGWAFEEYVGLKWKDQRATSGRVDLEFELKELRFVAEAKQIWLALTRNRDHSDKISKACKEAIDDVRCCEDYGVPKLAIVFAVPYLSATNSEGDIAKKTKELIGKVSKFIPKPDASAWYFPIASEAPRFEHKRKEKRRIYPGVFLLIWKV